MNQQKVSQSKTRAVIFDMDGVIVDSGPYHFKAWREAFRKKGVNLTHEAFRRIFGLRSDSKIREILGNEVPPGEIEAISEERDRLFRKLIKPHVRALPGVIKLIKSLKEHKFKIALASSAVIENIRLTIQTLGIESYFDAIVYGPEVAESKPSPQIFLLAAEKLGVEPANCIVIEDAVAGVTAAKKGGMHSLAVTNTHPRESLKEADLIVGSLKEITMDDLEQLLKPSRD